MRLLYNIIVLISALPGLLYFLLKMLLTGKYRRSFLQKLGLRQSHFLENIGPGPRLWMHAVSVGEAVSYTHLRAHETVLDLVCRLLLEKKKYIIYIKKG